MEGRPNWEKVWTETGFVALTRGHFKVSELNPQPVNF